MMPTDIRAAQTELRSYLERLFGPKLPGISGFGVGLDLTTREPALNVMTTSARATSRARAQLPDHINGLSVKVSQRGPATFE